jgi:hypothetical protein
MYYEFDTILNYMKINPTMPEYIKALAASIVGLVSIAIGYKIAVGDVKFKIVPMAAITPRALSAFGIFCLVATPMIIYSIVTTSRGVSGELVGGVYILVGATGYIIDAQLMLLPLSLLLIVISKYRAVSFIPLIIFLSYALIFGRVRWMLVVALIAAYLMYSQFIARRFRILPVLVLAPIAAIIFTIKGLDREVFVNMIGGAGARALSETSFSDSWRSRLDTMDFANFDYLTYIVSVVPSGTGTYTYFTQWLQLFTEPIPRILWPGKPIGAPIQFFNLNDYGNFIGLTNSIVGDGWMSYGWVGVIMTCSICGAILGKIYCFAAARAHDPIIVCAYSIFVGLTIQLYRDGGISIFKFALFGVFPLIVIWWWAGISASAKVRFKRSKFE